MGTIIRESRRDNRITTPCTMIKYKQICEPVIKRENEGERERIGERLSWHIELSNAVLLTFTLLYHFCSEF